MSNKPKSKPDSMAQLLARIDSAIQRLEEEKTKIEAEAAALQGRLDYFTQKLALEKFLRAVTNAKAGNKEKVRC